MINPTTNDGEKHPEFSDLLEYDNPKGKTLRLSGKSLHGRVEA